MFTSYLMLWCFEIPRAIRVNSCSLVASPQGPQAVQLRCPLGAHVAEHLGGVVRRQAWISASPPGAPLVLHGGLQLLNRRCHLHQLGPGPPSDPTLATKGLFSLAGGAGPLDELAAHLPAALGLPAFSGWLQLPSTSSWLAPPPALQQPAQLLQHHPCPANPGWRPSSPCRELCPPAWTPLSQPSMPPHLHPDRVRAYTTP